MKQTVIGRTRTKYRFMHPDREEDDMHERDFEWTVEVESEIQDLGGSNKNIKLETVEEAIDVLDGVIAINHNDPLFSKAVAPGEFEEVDSGEVDLEDYVGKGHMVEDEIFGTWVKVNSEQFGEVIAFIGDPTIEFLVEWLAREVYELDASIEQVTVTCHEKPDYRATVKYPEQ